MYVLFLDANGNTGRMYVCYVCILCMYPMYVCIYCMYVFMCKCDTRAGISSVSTRQLECVS